MKRTVLLCTISAIFGAVLAAAVTELPKVGSVSSAQEPLPRLVEIGSPPPAAPPGNVAPAASGYEDLTPEERVNVAVYEKVTVTVIRDGRQLNVPVTLEAEE